MAFNIVETSAIAGLHSFLELGKIFPAKTTAHYYYQEEQSETSPNKYQKRFQVHSLLENMTALYGTQHQHPTYAFPLIYYFASGIENFLVNDGFGKQVVEDIENQKESSDTYVALKKRQLDLLINTEDGLRGTAVLMRTSTAATIKKLFEFTKNIQFDAKSTMTEKEIETFREAGLMTDIKKGCFTNEIILPSTTITPPDLLFPPLK